MERGYWYGHEVHIIDPKVLGINGYRLCCMGSSVIDQ